MSETEKPSQARSWESRWEGGVIRHYKGAAGEIDQYINTQTGLPEKIILRSNDGRLATMELDSQTGKLNRLIEYNADGIMTKMDDQKAIRSALNTDALWCSRLLEEIKIQHGNSGRAAFIIDEMLNEMMHLEEQKQ